MEKMTNIEKAKKLYPYDDCEDEFTRNMRNGIIDLLRKAFVEGCKHVESKFGNIIKDKSVDVDYLQNWYQDSIDESIEPIWTDRHLEEICMDFYIIPKDEI